MRRSPPESRPTGDRHQLPQRREDRQDSLLALRRGRARLRGVKAPEIEMLLDGEAVEDLVALRDEGQSLAHD